MLKHIVSDPNDLAYPFTCEIFDNSSVAYHGTWSTYCASIEAAGLDPARTLFSKEDVLTIIRALDAIGFHDEFFGYRNEAKREAVYFAQDYWVARRYAVAPGGEAVSRAVETMELLTRIAADSLHRAEYRSRLEEDYPGSPLVPEWLECLDDPTRISALANEAESAARRLTRVAERGYPVVYAVKVEMEWFGGSPTIPIPDAFCLAQAIDLGCPRPVPANCLLARADFPNGIEDRGWGVAPQTWKEARGSNLGR